ncbi:LLM class flavin-dependent oxidoreductase [Actinomadura barringtoniae]|uniref:LLM class flavin-dependent oxidoreductase n=1 Tax=Actinomadura barringtoniae TaxID=1427535 RepID=A0A939T990_9ACTN|nr:LLM class flavin-dependent oxidoreductase [Actinomadura barringtoniae]MBO2454943.1 LLM class flavin-dependent oxidoreductase [Actinomadura barringtoniae]
MKHGISLLPDCRPARRPARDYFADVLEVARIADAAGIDYIKMTEHYLKDYGGYCPSPLGFLASVASCTSQIRLMTGCIQAAFHHPVQIAAETAMVDAISDGRLEVGFARAWLPYEFEAFGVPLDESRARFQATIEAVLRLWTEEKVTEEITMRRAADCAIGSLTSLGAGITRLAFASPARNRKREGAMPPARRPGAGSSPDRSPVTVTTVVAVALQMLEEEGLEALTMRRVAGRLGMQAPSLYWHISGKDELLDLVADALLAGLDLSALAAEGGDWEDALIGLAIAYRDYLKARRDAARVLAGRFIAGPAFIRNSEIMLGLLHDAGMPTRDATYALHLIVTYVQGFVLQETVPMSAQEAAESRGATLEQLRATLRDLPPAEFPRVRDGADDLTSADVDGRFVFGIKCITAGLPRVTAAPDEA